MENNIKIRSIEIEAFRGYNRRVLFDFTIPGGKLADLIVIYAPNGFGKTSFFDAVEWAIKGNIERFKEDTLMMQTAQRERGNILKNSESDLDAGRVKIIDESNNYFERFTTLKSEQWDLLKGSTKNNSTSKIKINQDLYDESRRVEILPQSRVDAFIASKKPTERYESLVDFWGGQDDSNYYRAISELTKHNEKLILQLEDQIKKIKQEIIILLIPDEKALLIDDLIINIKSKNIFTSDSLFYKDLNDSNDLNTLITLITDKIIDFENTKYKLWETKDKLNILSENFPIFLENKLKKESFSKEIAKAKSLLNIYQQRILTNDRINTIRNNLLELNDEINDVTYLIENIEVYNNFSININQGNNTISLLTLGNQDLTNKLRGLEYDRIISTQQISTLLSKRFTSSNLKIELEEIKAQYSASVIKLRLIENRILLAREVSFIREKRLKNTQDEISNFNKILSLNIEQLLTSKLINPNNPTIKILKYNLEKVNVLKEELKIKNEQHQKKELLNSNLESIISLGHYLVKSTETNICPLCNTTHEDFNALLENININKDAALGIDSTRNIIEQLNSQIHELVEINIRLFEDYKIHTEFYFNSLSIPHDKLLSKLNKSLLFVTFYSLEKEIIESNIRRLEKQLGDQNIIFEKIDKHIDELRIEMSEFDNSIEVSKNTLNLLNISIDETNQQIALNANKISELSSEIYIFSINSIFSKIQQIISKRTISLDNLEKEKLDNLYSSLIISLTSYNDELNLATELYENYNSQLVGIDLQALRNQVQESDYIINNINIILNDFTFQYSRIFNSSNYNLDMIGNRLVELNIDINEIENNIVLLRQYKENGTYFQNSFEIISKRKSISILETELNKHIETGSRLNIFHKTLSNFLKDKINSVFNHEIINDIYQKIDPHPNFKSIHLEPIFNDKPELLIKVVDNSNQNVVDPILYLSSAQVSILSLSIFFAKAIQNSSPLVNTIFMDDPIQYMDSINTLSFIDLIRSIISDKQINRQIVLSTHDDNFFRLLKRKFDVKYYKSKFIEFESYGILKQF